MAEPQKILIVDDHPLFLEALHRAISSQFAGSTIFEATSIEEAQEILKSESGLDVILLDLALPGTRGFEGLLELRSQHPTIPTVIVSALEDPRIIHDAMRYGAAGFISKSAPRAEIADALKEVMEGSVTLPKGYRPLDDQDDDHCNEDIASRLQSLTPKQLSVLKMLRQGLLNKQIAYELQIEETTVKAHVSEILRKMNVASRTQAVIEVQKIDFENVMNENR